MSPVNGSSSCTPSTTREAEGALTREDLAQLQSSVQALENVFGKLMATASAGFNRLESQLDGIGQRLGELDRRACRLASSVRQHTPRYPGVAPIFVRESPDTGTGMPL